MRTNKESFRSFTVDVTVEDAVYPVTVVTGDRAEAEKIATWHAHQKHYLKKRHNIT